MKTPHDDKIDALCYCLTPPEKNNFLPQLYETDPEPEAEPEQWPKENPYIKAAEQVFDEVEKIKAVALECGQYIIRGFADALKAINPTLQKLAAEFAKIAETLFDVTTKALNAYPDKRVVYLATHGKGRTRKKNINRILKWYERQGRKPREKNKKRGFIRYVEENGKKWAVFVTY